MQFGAVDRLRQSFAAQFEPEEGRSFLYRQDQKGPAIRLNADEHRQFIQAYDRVLRWSFWIVFGGTILIAGGLALALGREIETRSWILYPPLIAVAAGFVAWQMWARYAPARALARRRPVSPALSPAASKRLAMHNLSYGQLALGALAVPFMIWNASRGWDITRGWGLLWIAGGVILFAIIAVQAVRKWRFEQGRK